MQRGSTKGLKEAARARSDESIRTVNAAIDRMKERKQKITFVSVAKESGISRTTLYQTPVLKERIESLKALGRSDDNNVQRAIKNSETDLEKQLREEIRRLKKEKKQLIEQLIDRQELICENLRLQDMIDRMKEQMRTSH